MKKGLSLLIFFAMLLCALVSCSGITNDLLKLADQFDEKDYWVDITIDDDDIKAVADEFEIRAKGIEYILVVIPEDDDGEKTTMGVFIFCEDTATAKNAEEDLNAFIDENEDFRDNVTRGIVERKGTLVFIGCEDAWEDKQ